MSKVGASVVLINLFGAAAQTTLFLRATTVLEMLVCAFGLIVACAVAGSVFAVEWERR